MPNNKTVEVTVDIIHETDAALLVSDAGEEVWIPKSQITEEIPMSGNTSQLEIPEWLALEKGLI